MGMSGLLNLEAKCTSARARPTAFATPCPKGPCAYANSKNLMTGLAIVHYQHPHIVHTPPIHHFLKLFIIFFPFMRWVSSFQLFYPRKLVILIFEDWALACGSKSLYFNLGLKKGTVELFAYALSRTKVVAKLLEKTPAAIFNPEATPES
nr:hypothetical protein Iba_chr01aCG20880 [Ipomoea batatas]